MKRDTYMSARDTAPPLRSDIIEAAKFLQWASRRFIAESEPASKVDEAIASWQAARSSGIEASKGATPTKVAEDAKESPDGGGPIEKASPLEDGGKDLGAGVDSSGIGAQKEPARRVSDAKAWLEARVAEMSGRHIGAEKRGCAREVVGELGAKWAEACECANNVAAILNDGAPLQEPPGFRIRLASTEGK